MSLPDPFSHTPEGNEAEFVVAVEKYDAVLKKHDMPSAVMVLAACFAVNAAMARNGKGRAFLVDLIVNASSVLGHAREIFFLREGEP